MSRKERYPREVVKKSKPIKKEPCPSGWHCFDILQDRCEHSHDKDDHKYAKKLNYITKNLEIIVILDTYDPKLSPICLLDPSLPINAVNQ
jgi:hypothetical protein